MNIIIYTKKNWNFLENVSWTHETKYVTPEVMKMFRWMVYAVSVQNIYVLLLYISGFYDENEGVCGFNKFGSKFGINLVNFVKNFVNFW